MTVETTRYNAVLSRSRHLTLRFLSLPGFLILTLGGCGFVHSTSVETGNPIDGSAVKRIVIGKTTRSEVFSSFGTPHSIFQNQVDFRSYLAVNAGGARFEFADTRTLTTWSDKQYGVLYRSGSVSGVSWAASVAVVTVAGTHFQVRPRELLVFFDKQSHVVEEVAYTRAPD